MISPLLSTTSRLPLSLEFSEESSSTTRSGTAPVTRITSTWRRPATWVKEPEDVRLKGIRGQHRPGQEALDSTLASSPQLLRSRLQQGAAQHPQGPSFPPLAPPVTLPLSQIYLPVTCPLSHLHPHPSGTGQLKGHYQILPGASYFPCMHIFLRLLI